MKTRNSSHQQKLEVRGKFSLVHASIWKQECVKEAKIVKTGAKFIIRDTAQQMGEHREKQFI